MVQAIEKVKLNDVKRKLSDVELVAEIDAAMEDPQFRRAVKEFVKKTTS